VYGSGGKKSSGNHERERKNLLMTIRTVLLLTFVLKKKVQGYEESVQFVPLGNQGTMQEGKGKASEFKSKGGEYWDSICKMGDRA